MGFNNSSSWAQQLWLSGSRELALVVVVHRLSCSAVQGISLDQGSDQCPLHWQVDSKPLDHQGSPFQPFILQVVLQVRNLRTPQGSLSAWLHVGAVRSSDSLLGGVFACVSAVSVILVLFLMPTWGFRPQGFFMWLERLIAWWFRESCTFQKQEIDVTKAN